MVSNSTLTHIWVDDVHNTKSHSSVYKRQLTDHMQLTDARIWHQLVLLGALITMVGGVCDGAGLPVGAATLDTRLLAWQRTSCSPQPACSWPQRPPQRG